MRSFFFLFLCANVCWAEAERPWGAIVAPAVLEKGQTSVYGILGAPELVAGFRQGIHGVELQAFAGADYVQLSAYLEGGVRTRLFKMADWDIALGATLAGVLNSGSTYLEAMNARYFALRPRLSTVATYHWVETASALFQLDVPWALTLNPEGGWRLSPLLGGGVELFLADGVSGLVMAQMGTDTLAMPNMPAETRLNWQVKLGVGWKIF